MRDFLRRFPQICLCNGMNSSGSTILYLQLEINFLQQRCLSVIILDTTVLVLLELLFRRYIKTHTKLPKIIRLELQSESSARESENGKFPKVVRRGCKRSFEPRERKRGCTSAKRVCTGAKRVSDGAKDSWETFAP